MTHQGRTSYFLLFITAITLTLLLTWQYRGEQADHLADDHKIEQKHYPSEHFFLQRSYPDSVFALKAYEDALNVARLQMQQKKYDRNSNESWVLEGPTNIGGRINTIAVHPGNPDIIYVGNASGGVFKTVDGGTNWNPIFDDQPFLAIGDIEIDPNYPDTIYVGTGDVNISGYPFIGDGIYKSTDGGATWTHIGLTDTRIISRILVHPTNSNIIYASTMGLPFERNNDRGLYKSIDGGNTWSQILFASTGSGIVDFVVDPNDPDLLLAAGWDRIRNNHESIISGPNGIIYRSDDGGTSWTDLSSALLPDTVSRIGLSLAPSGKVVAQVLDRDQNTLYIFSSNDMGLSWSLIPSTAIGNIMGGFGWYFGKVRINPYDTSEVYVLGVDLWRTTDHGTNWNQVGPGWYTYEVHADKHDLVFIDANTMLLATDGGLYKSIDNGDTWTDIENLPNTQLYHVKVNPHSTRDYWAGAQDNGTTHGNFNDTNGWPRVFGGDGFNPVFHPLDSQIIYCETQNGGILVTLDGGQSFTSASQGLGFNSVERKNWDMPYIISQHDPNIMYAGTYRMMKSLSSTSVYYNPISPDLTDGLILHPRYHTITTIRESPLSPRILLAGTVDANVWKTTDGGNAWIKIDSGLPNHYVTDVEASFIDSNTIFVSHSGYKENEFIPHIHKSNDLGDTWANISGNLPQLAINDLEVSRTNDSLIFVATDGGVYYTTNQGSSWSRLGNNMPIMAIYDVEIDDELNRLVAGTYARSVQSISLDGLPATIGITASVSQDATICEADSLQLYAGGGSNYSWSPATGLSCTSCPNPVASPLVTTTYSVTVSDGDGNEDEASVTITVLPLPPQLEIVVISDTLSVNPAGDYIWLFNDVPVSHMSSAYYIPQTRGYYQALLTNHNGCKSVSAKYAFFPTGIDQSRAAQLQIFPNPVSDVMHVRGVTPKMSLQYHIYDVKGQLMQRQAMINPDNGIQVKELPAGIYLLLLNSKDISKSIRFIKR